MNKSDDTTHSCYFYSVTIYIYSIGYMSIWLTGLKVTGLRF